MSKTYSAKPTEVARQWHVLDASEVTLGRLSTVAAKLLTGKHKPMFTPHTDCGDFVIVINAKNLKVTGNKLENKIYYSHSQYPGSLKEVSLKDKMSRDPTLVVRHSIRGMLPLNKLRDERLKRLKVYVDSDHQHSAQKPEILRLREAK